MELLTAHLRRLASERFELGRLDCLLALADWVALRTGVDLGAEFRGRYTTPREWMRLVQRAGGMPALVAKLITRVGWYRVNEARIGDVAVVLVDHDHGPAGAIRGERYWHLKLHHGLVAASSPPILGVWGPR